VNNSDEYGPNCCRPKNGDVNLNLVRQARLRAAGLEKRACKAKLGLLVWQMGTGNNER